MVDSLLPDAALLADRLAAQGVEVCRLHPGASSLHQLAALLDDRRGLAAVHLFSHGAPGELALGDERLNARTLPDQSESLAAIGRALRPGGDLLLYGCRVGQDPAFVQRLADAAGADVAASTNRTGARDQGGDWELETASGTVETRSLRVPEYPHVFEECLVSGAGTGGVDGTYSRAGSYGGKPLYRMGGMCYLGYTSNNRWVIARGASSTWWFLARVS